MLRLFLSENRTNCHQFVIICKDLVACNINKNDDKICIIHKNILCIYLNQQYNKSEVNRCKQ